MPQTEWSFKNVLLVGLALLVTVSVTNGQQVKGLSEDRVAWLNYMDKIARPVITNMANNTLKEKMSVMLSPNVDHAAQRTKVAYLEAFGRTLSGIAPWLNLEGGADQELRLRNQYRDWAIKAISNAVNSSAKDYVPWAGGQPLVDASFLALGLIRCPWLWQHLDTLTKGQVITAFKQTRATVPVYSNWLLFTGMIETFFCNYGYEYDPVRIDYGVREFANHWYVGDGLYSDGMDFHMDYYNSIVIHPFLATILAVMQEKNKSYGWYGPKFDSINKRYAQILERMIGTDGSYPLIGRSIVYRGGVFHQLADIALRKKLPASLPPAQVRSALTAVIRKTLESSATFTKAGWLMIGVSGSQAGLADFYITTGSLYICLNIFLPLGLSSTDPFWTGPTKPWTSVQAWQGRDLPADHALDLN